MLYYLASELSAAMNGLPLLVTIIWIVPYLQRMSWKIKSASVSWFLEPSILASGYDETEQQACTM
jgi:hypothetical protein